MTRHREESVSTVAQTKRRRVPNVAVVVLVVIVAFALGTVLVPRFISVYAVPSESMAHTIEEGNGIVVFHSWKRLRPDAVLEVERGDVVVFRDDEGWLNGSPLDTDTLVKRVVGIGGDVVQGLPDGTLLVNGVGVDESAYIATEVSTSRPFYVEVPPGRLWVMGDNRDASADSRAHRASDYKGTVSEDAVVGVVLLTARGLLSYVDTDGRGAFATVTER